jgi:YD repeat-containing protein
MLAEIVNPVVTGTVAYSPVIDPSSYSINTSLAVVKTPGELTVSGMAGYTLPVSLPKGINGLQPELNLSYASTFIDGMLGIGWDLGGLSSISRVNQNLYFDGQSNPIKGNLTDKYALDGNRMILISGTYGYDNSVYGTEVEEFSKIVAHGSTGQGPEYFEVFTRSGLIYQYGNTADSKVKRDGSCVLTWKLNRITDRYSNYITFSYFDSDDEQLICQIDYTGNSAQGKSPFAQVKFHYKQRTDVSTYVYGGREFTRDLLLDNIEITNNGQAFKKHEMVYCQVDNRTQLLKVTENSSQNQPLNPTVFAYTNQYEYLMTSSFYVNSTKERFFHGDFNGDGRMDFVTIPSKTYYDGSENWKLYVANTSGGMTYKSQSNLRANLVDILIADFNSDGLTDMMTIYHTTGLHGTYDLCLYVSTKNDLVPDDSYYWSIDDDVFDKYNFNVVDYNGDGKKEVFVFGTRDYVLYSYSGSKICDGRADYDLLDAGKHKDRTAEIFDFNNDGCSDIIAVNGVNLILYEFKDIENKLLQTYPQAGQQNYLSAGEKIDLSDFNGDGITDILETHGTLNKYFDINTFATGNINSWRGISIFSNFDMTSTNNQWRICDVNGDGIQDIVIWGKGNSTSNSANHINVAINSGNGYEYNLIEYIQSVTFDMADTQYFYFADYNGDGCNDFFYSKPGSQRLYSFTVGTPSNLLSAFVDGLGNKTTLTYLPMTNSAVYAKGSGATYPLVDFISPQQLVYQASADNGIGGTTSTTYKYVGAEVHLQGKGFLGFSTVTGTNSATGVSTNHTYEIDPTYFYPKLKSFVTRRDGNDFITATTNQWSNLAFSDKRFFPYISTSSESNGLTGLTVGTTTVYEKPGSTSEYANLKSVTTEYDGGHTRKTEYLYGNEIPASWLIGRPTTITETSVKGSDTQTFVTTRTYFSTNNSPDIDQNNSGDASWWQLNRDYDPFGNLWKEHKATTGLTETHTTYDYGTEGVNLMKVTDPAGTETNYTYDQATGRLKTVTDPFGNVTTYNYNSADQLYTIVPSTGITTTINRSFNVTGGPSYARYYIDQTGNDGSQTKVWYDKLGRELRTETKKYGGALVKIDKQYDAKGQLAQVSEPGTGTPSYWNILGYDDFGRITSSDPYYGPTTSYSYNFGDPTTTRTINGRTYETTIDATGSVTGVLDPGGAITYNYWPNGLLKSVLAPGSITTLMTYDKNGNRLTLNDPSAGLITNTWYGTGQPKTVVNAKGETTTYSYYADQRGLLQKQPHPKVKPTIHTIQTAWSIPLPLRAE